MDKTSPPSLWDSIKRRLFSFGRSNGNGTITETIEELLEDNPAEDLILDQEQKVLLANIFRLSDITAEDIMIPRVDIIAIEVGASHKELIDALSEHSHSRMPVYRKTLDDALGLVHIKDVLTNKAAESNFKLKHLIRPALFVVGSTPVMDIFLKMRQKQTHLALVVDEFGGVDGLVTIEDLVEQIVGEIEDEHDVVEAPKLEPQEDGTLISDARAELEEFEEWVGEVFPKEESEDIDTLGGFVCALAARVPDRGEIIPYRGKLEFEVLDADPRRLKRLRVRRLTKGKESVTTAA